jgi:hypothetical protein
MMIIIIPMSSYEKVKQTRSYNCSSLADAEPFRCPLTIAMCFQRYDEISTIIRCCSYTTDA